MSIKYVAYGQSTKRFVACFGGYEDVGIDYINQRLEDVTKFKISGVDKCFNVGFLFTDYSLLGECGIFGFILF